MLKINSKKIIQNINKKNIKINPSKVHRIYLDNYLLNYIEYIKLFKNISKKNITIINELDDNFDLVNLFDKSYLNKNEKVIKLGEGYQGAVYKLNNNICVKAEISNLNSYTVEDFNNEYYISKLCGKYNISPKIYKKKIFYNKFNSKLIKLIYMEYIKGLTLNDFIEKYKPSTKKIENINKIINKKINILHKLGFLHQDLHKGNIMIHNNKNKIINIYIIDFGFSIKINNMNKIIFENNYDYKQNLLNYFIYKKYIDINWKISNKLTNKIKDIYQNIKNNETKNEIKNKELNYQYDIFNINFLAELIINNVIKNTCNKNNICDSVVHKRDFLKVLQKDYNIKKYEFIKNVEHYKYLNINYNNINQIMKIIDHKNNNYICLIYDEVYFSSNNNKKEILNISKKLYENNLSLNIIDYKFIINNNNFDDRGLYIIIKLNKNEKLENFKSIINNNKIGEKNIIDFYKKIQKKLLDLNLLFMTPIDLLTLVRNHLFIINNNINLFLPFNIDNLNKNYHKNNNEELTLTNIQKVKFINELVKNKILNIS
jgi:tRNA A-37 threonylcarbamoyl transferase component Bud32